MNFVFFYNTSVLSIYIKLTWSYVQSMSMCGFTRCKKQKCTVNTLTHCTMDLIKVLIIANRVGRTGLQELLNLGFGSMVTGIGWVWI